MQSKKIMEPINNSTNERKRLWKAAIKWPLYSVAVMPIVIAAGWKQAIGENIRWDQLIGFLFASVFLLIWENLTNDLFDADTGVDKFKLHSIVALIGKRSLVKRLAYLALLIGLLLILILATRSSFIVLFLVMSCCCLGYLYQGPPFRLGYHSLGEPLCWLAFGPFATAASLLVISSKNIGQTGVPWTTAILIGSGPALATTLVLFCSHFHQVIQDSKSGKYTLLVRLGTERAAQLIPWFVVVTLAIEFVPILYGRLPVSAILGIIGLPSALRLITLLTEHHNQPHLIVNSKFLALEFQALNGFGFSIGLALAPILGIYFAHPI
tara:strand:- start:44233 stop:45204 length:972 start_codon:yes stop_codon:yes gene_type:complete